MKKSTKQIVVVVFAGFGGTIVAARRELALFRASRSTGGVIEGIKTGETPGIQ